MAGIFPEFDVNWTPRRLLALFMSISFTVYLDRGVVASNGVQGSPPLGDGQDLGSGIMGQFNLSYFEAGLLPAFFMVGLLLASPIFAEAAKHKNAFRLIGTGLVIWAIAVLGCGISFAFGWLVICRMVVGVGEASFIALAAPFIDDQAPPEEKTLWLGLFYMMIPVGVASGYIVGGLIGAGIGWRAAFFFEALLMIPAICLTLGASPIDMRGTDKEAKGPGQGEASVLDDSEDRQRLLPTASGAQSPAPSLSGEPAAPQPVPRPHPALEDRAKEFVQDAKCVFSHHVFTYNLAAGVTWCAVLGAYSYWGPKAGKEVFGLQQETADTTFGLVTVFTGIVGSVAGGYLLDKVGSTMRNALMLCAVSTAIALVLVFFAFSVAKSFGAFIFLFALGELGLFASQAPSSAVALWCVPPQLRPFAMSVTTVFLHLLGDVPSPPIVGAIQGSVKNWRVSMGLLSIYLMLSTGFYLLAAWEAPRATDYRPEEEKRVAESVAAARAARASAAAAVTAATGHEAQVGVSSDSLSPRRPAGKEASDQPV